MNIDIQDSIKELVVLEKRLAESRSIANKISIELEKAKDEVENNAREARRHLMNNNKIWAGGKSSTVILCDGYVICIEPSGGIVFFEPVDYQL